MDYKIYRKILNMVGELHQQGYQRIRIAPGMSASGMYWRCAITPVSNISFEHGARIAEERVDHNLIASYSSAEGDRYFGWDDTGKAGLKKLADLFIKRFSRIAEAGYGQDWEYAGWYQWMLKLTYPDTFPIAYADWDFPAEYLPSTGGRNDIQIPLPPPGKR